MKPIVLSTLTLVPVALGLSPAGRWGHQAVYVPSQAAMYIVGGQVSTTNFQITNDVLVYPLNTTTPTFSLGANDGLPPHAFASMAISSDESSLVVFGGMTSSCHNDGLLHTMDLDEGDWSSITPASVERRRGAGMAWVDTGSGQGGMMVVGGLADAYSCAASTSAYTAADILALPLRASSLLSSRNLPSALTGDQLAVADYAMTSNNGTIYMVGGQSASGSLVDLTTIGVWDEAAGWHSETTSGDVPSGRIGSSLVAHPTLDLLILHGGSTSAPSGKDTPSQLVALLNTTSMVWSQPSGLQPASSAAKSHHSSIMTPSGIMISAFGLSSTNTPRSDVSYLDARSANPASWTWTTTWSSDFMHPSTSTIKKPETETAGKSGSNLSGGTIAGIVVPLLLLTIIGLPIIVYLIRRRLRLIKKRKMAEHFSFSSQVDDNDNGFFGRRRASGRVTNAQYPFGRDANEKEGTFMTDLGNKARGLLKRYSTRSTISSVGQRSVDEDAHEVPMGGYSDKEMRPMTPLNPRSAKWEEIDFGLGRLDESRRASALDPYEPTAMINNDMPLISISSPDLEHPQQNRMTNYGSPTSDGQGPLIPSLIVQPPSNPSTPGSQYAPVQASPFQATNPDPFADPMPTVHEYAPPTAQEDDWSMLQNQLASNPAFRSISPTSTLRSHQHSPQQQQQQQQQSSARNISSTRPPVYAQNPAPIFSASPRSRASSTFPMPAPNPTTAAAPRPRSATPPQLPPLDLGRTITLVNPKTGRRVSETLPLAGRRGSMPLAMPMARSPSSSGSTTPTANWDNTLRRASNPMPIPVPAPVNSSPVLDSANNGQRRVSTMSKLRVMNPSSDDESSESAGQAL